MNCGLVLNRYQDEESKYLAPWQHVAASTKKSLRKSHKFPGILCRVFHFPFAYDPDKSLWKNAQKL